MSKEKKSAQQKHEEKLKRLYERDTKVLRQQIHELRVANAQLEQERDQALKEAADLRVALEELAKRSGMTATQALHFSESVSMLDSLFHGKLSGVSLF